MGVGFSSWPTTLSVCFTALDTYHAWMRALKATDNRGKPYPCPEAFVMIQTTWEVPVNELWDPYATYAQRVLGRQGISICIGWQEMKPSLLVEIYVKVQPILGWVIFWKGSKNVRLKNLKGFHLELMFKVIFQPCSLWRGVKPEMVREASLQHHQRNSVQKRNHLTLAYFNFKGTGTLY